MTHRSRSARFLSALVLILGLTGWPGAGAADSPPGGDTVASPTTEPDRAMAPEPYVPQNCVDNDPRSACQIQSRGIATPIRPQLKPNMCLQPIVAGSRGAEYESIVLSPCQFNDASFLWVKVGAVTGGFAIKHVQSGKCMRVMGDQLHLRLCSGEIQGFAITHLPAAFPGAPSSGVILHPYTKLGPIPVDCVKYSSTAASSSGPGSPMFNVSVADCPKSPNFGDFLWQPF